MGDPAAARRQWARRRHIANMAQVVTPEELLVRVSKRDEDALGDLYDRFAPRLLGALAHILRDRRWAEEVLQEVFLCLWSEAHNLAEAKVSVAAWLVLNARHLALARLRSEEQERAHTATEAAKAAKFSAGKVTGSKSHSAKAPAAAAVLPAAWIPFPEEVARVDERLELLQKVINQLPKPQREALELSVFGGFNEEDIARELDEPLGKVRTSLSAAVTFLRHRRRAVVGTWAANI